jgi:hypothetical protein
MKFALWILPALPAAFYVGLCYAFRPILWGRREEIKSIMARGETFQAYLMACGLKSDEEMDAVLDAIFYRTFGWARYYLPLALLGATSFAATAITVVWSGLDLGLAAPLQEQIRALPSASIAGLAGAFIWGLYDAVRRCATVDLAPVTVHYVALRMLVAIVIAPMLTAAFADAARPFLAFTIGAFPIRELQDFIRGQARNKLNLTAQSEPVEQPTLHHLQGITSNMLQRLQDEGIHSVAHLAGADPIKLLLKTNIEWKVILDLIDQAILHGYVDEKIAALRRCGIRGAIELASLRADLSSNDAVARDRASRVTQAIANKLDEDFAAVSNMVRNVDEDVQVNLLRSLWGDESLGSEAREEPRAFSAAA